MADFRKDVRDTEMESIRIEMKRRRRKRKIHRSRTRRQKRTRRRLRRNEIRKRKCVGDDKEGKMGENARGKGEGNRE